MSLYGILNLQKRWNPCTSGDLRICILESRSRTSLYIPSVGQNTVHHYRFVGALLRAGGFVVFRLAKSFLPIQSRQEYNLLRVNTVLLKLILDFRPGVAFWFLVRGVLVVVWDQPLTSFFLLRACQNVKVLRDSLKAKFQSPFRLLFDKGLINVLLFPFLFFSPFFIIFFSFQDLSMYFLPFCCIFYFNLSFLFSDFVS